MSAVSVANYFIDLLFALLYFQRQDNADFPWWKKLAGLCCLLLTLVLYPTGVFPFLSGTVQRFFLRILLTLMFVYISVPLKWISAVYGVCYWCTVHLLAQSLFFLPHTYALFNGTAVFTGNAASDWFICIFLTLLVKLAVFLPFTRLTPLVNISPVQPADLLPVGLVAAAAIYGRELAVPLVQAGTAAPISSGAYYLILQLALLILLGYMERSRRARQEHAVTQLQKQEAEALLRGVQNQNANAQVISALRHDLKNHLLTIQLLLSEGKPEEADQYIATLLEKTAPIRKTYNTGSELVNGLLSVKLDETHCRGLDVSVNLDMRSGSFLSNYDLCVLFGNVIDNALEACRELSPEEHPYFRISGGQSANVLLLRFENSCKTAAVLVNGLPLTAKADARLHGFGLRNVSMILKKYDGNLSITQEHPGEFVLTMLIPIPQE